MKKKQNKETLGYTVHINVSGEKGQLNWQHVGYLFQSKDEAYAYRAKHHPTATKYRVQAARVNTKPVSRADAA
jgi:hypothetical protein